MHSHDAAAHSHCGIMPIIACLLKGLLNPETSFYTPSAVAKKVNGGKKKRPHWREYAILYTLLGALLHFDKRDC